MARTSIPVETKKMVLHIAGYKCANPSCRTFLSLEIHHVVEVSKSGGNGAENLLALCPTCHALYHAKTITQDSIRTWHNLLLTLNEALPPNAVEVLIVLFRLPELEISGDGVLDCASLLSSGLIEITSKSDASLYTVQITTKGRHFIESWIKGDEHAAIEFGEQKAKPPIDLVVFLGPMENAIPAYANRVHVLRFWLSVENKGSLPAKSVALAIAGYEMVTLVNPQVHMILNQPSQREDGTSVNVIRYESLLYPKFSQRIAAIDILIRAHTKPDDIPLRIWALADNYESSGQEIIVPLSKHREHVEKMVQNSLL